MSDPVQIALIGMIGGAVASIGPIVVAILTRRRIIENHTETQKSIEVVRQDVNGKMEKMQEVIAKASKAEGKLEERTEADARARE